MALLHLQAIYDSSWQKEETRRNFPETTHSLPYAKHFYVNILKFYAYTIISLDHNDSLVLPLKDLKDFSPLSSFPGLGKPIRTVLNRNDGSEYLYLDFDFKGDTFNITPVTIWFCCKVAF